MKWMGLRKSSSWEYKIHENLSWSKNKAILPEKIQTSLPTRILGLFYRGAVKSLLAHGISSWFSSCSVADLEALQRVGRSAERPIGVSLPFVQEIILSCCRNRVQTIVKDFSHPLNNFFWLLPSQKLYIYCVLYFCTITLFIYVDIKCVVY